MISLFGSPFTKNIRSNKDHDIHLEINVKKDKLYISCHYYVKYFITKFEKEFSLEELISQSDYYKQFQNVGQILGEIRNNSSDTKRNIKEEIEELDDPKKIKVIIYLNSKLYKSLSYVLDKREKTEKEILEEYKSIIKIYENKSPINGFGNSKIITDKTKLFLKAWISPIYNVQANLLYSFNLTYPKKFEDSFWSGRNFTILEKVKEFHDKYWLYANQEVKYLGVIHHYHLIAQIPINMIMIAFYFPLIMKKNIQKIISKRMNLFGAIRILDLVFIMICNSWKIL